MKLDDTLKMNLVPILLLGQIPVREIRKMVLELLQRPLPDLLLDSPPSQIQMPILEQTIILTTKVPLALRIATATTQSPIHMTPIQTNFLVEGSRHMIPNDIFI